MVTVKRPNRKDVAKAAGVSVATVSMVMNHKADGRVTPATQKRVADIAKELGYRPNLIGRALVTGRTHTFGLLQPSHESLFYSLYHEIQFGLVNAMAKDESHLLMLFRDNDQSYTTLIEQSRLDGIFVLQSDMSTAHINTLTALDIPVVVMNKSVDVSAHPKLGCITSDSESIPTQVEQLAVKRGRQNLLFITEGRSIDANARIDEACKDIQKSSALNITICDNTSQSLDDFLKDELNAGTRWDCVFHIGGVSKSDIINDLFTSYGMAPGDDYDIYSAGDGRRHDHASGAFIKDSTRLGEEAWQLMSDILNNETNPRYRKVPVEQI
jgi:LacI family transcriptional regulator